MDDRAAIEARLRGGAWLRSGEVAVVLGVSRKTAYRMMRDGKLRCRERPGTGSQWEAHPDDVLRELARRGEIHGE